MCSSRCASFALSVVVVLLAVAEGRAQTPLGTAFTYQGRLKDGGAPADGDYDMRFRLYDALVGGSQIGGEFGVDNVNVADGLFKVVIDFGAQFPVEQRFLEIEVRPDTRL